MKERSVSRSGLSFVEALGEQVVLVEEKERLAPGSARIRGRG